MSGAIFCDHRLRGIRELASFIGRTAMRFGVGVLSECLGHNRYVVKAAVKSFEALLRVDTPQEVLYYQHGGILPYVLRQLLAAK
jgi:hypothetical protein